MIMDMAIVAPGKTCLPRLVFRKDRTQTPFLRFCIQVVVILVLYPLLSRQTFKNASEIGFKYWKVFENFVRKITAASKGIREFEAVS